MHSQSYYSECQQTRTKCLCISLYKIDEGGLTLDNPYYYSVPNIVSVAIMCAREVSLVCLCSSAQASGCVVDGPWAIAAH